MPRHWTIAACLSLCLAAASAQAETPAAFAARGAIVSADAANLTLKEADGTQDSFALAPGIRLLGMKTASLADVKAGDFVGIGSVADGKGGLKAVQVVIFPPAMVGTGEGSYPWKQHPGSTMTNATVSATVVAADATSVSVTYKDGKQSITVPPDAPILALVPSTAADLMPGAIAVVRGETGADAKHVVKSVLVGLNDTVPPT